MMKLRTLVLSMSVLSLFVSLNAQAQETTTTTVERKVIITPAPKATCSTVAGHWEDSVWVDSHSVCRYENRSEGAAWIDSYWSCTQAAADGTCSTWTLVPGHWVKTLD